MCLWLCITSVHNTSQNSSDNSYYIGLQWLGLYPVTLFPLSGNRRHHSRQLRMAACVLQLAIAIHLKDASSQGRGEYYAVDCTVDNTEGACWNWRYKRQSVKVDSRRSYSVIGLVVSTLFIEVLRYFTYLSVLSLSAICCFVYCHCWPVSVLPPELTLSSRSHSILPQSYSTLPKVAIDKTH